MSDSNSQKVAIPSYQDIAQETFGTLWADARPADWALVVYKLRQALQAKSNGPDGSGWRPIAEAPIEPFNQEQWFSRHSPYLLLWSGKSCTIGSYGYTQKGKGRWQTWSGNISPTHWMPLPAAPYATKELT